MAATSRRKRRLPWLSLIGPLLLILLFWQVDVGALVQVIRQVDGRFLLVAISLNLPMVLFKSLRWQSLMLSQHIRYQTRNAYLAYFGSIFIGLLTPGRLGEFVKALHVNRDCNVSLARAFSSVLVDRLYDLYLLLMVGSAALLTLVYTGTELLTLAASIAVLTLPLVLFLNNTVFAFAQRLGSQLGWVGQRVFAADGWLVEMRAGMRQLSPLSALLAVGLTILAYGVFFGQCYLLALALDVSLSYIEVSYAVSLGSLVALLPISISGLGTREAAMIAYLGTVGLSSEQALGFSLLVFATFYLAGGLFGAVAWGIKPAPLAALRQERGTMKH
jgi:hypothetical protein